MKLRSFIKRALRGRHSNLQDRLRAKFDYWFETPNAPPEVKALAMIATDKIAMQGYVKSLGLRLPKIYSVASTVDEIDFPALPDRVVIKPHNGWSANGVIIVDGERELLSHANVPRKELPAFCRRTLAEANRIPGPPRIIVEEFVRDYDERFAIPRDFKVFVAGGMAWVIQVIDRNPPREQRTHSFYKNDWTRWSDPFHRGRLRGQSIERPPLVEELIAAAERIARDLGAFLRLDFYLTREGPVFGEITWSPDDGIGFSRFGERYLCELIDRFPDRIRADLAQSIDLHQDLQTKPGRR